MNMQHFAALAALTVMTALALPAQPVLPRTADGKPNLEGIWQASTTADADLEDHAAGLNVLAGRSVLVGGGSIPYQPGAVVKKLENFRNRQAADPLSKCYMAGVPRTMFLQYPFQIFQTPQAIAIAFEWMLDYRLIYTDGKHPEDADFWMGDSRGHWEGDTLVVDVANINDKTWLDMAGDFHSDALHVVERYRMTDPDTIEYEATLEDSKVFTKPWTIRVPLRRRVDRDRLFEYVCQAELEEANGAFTRDPRTWYPDNGTAPIATGAAPSIPRPAPPVPANIHRKPDGKPDFQGFFVPDAGGANFGLEKHTASGLLPVSRGVLIDPPNSTLPMQPWAVKELADRNRPERGYDDPTAHCFPAGVPRAMYVPTSFYFVQTSDYLVILHERIAWRIIPLHERPHLPDSMRLWQGDSVGHWEGDSLLVDTTNLNGKTWLNEVGEIVSYAEHVVERFTLTGPDTISYEATVNDPVVYTRPWTIAMPFHRDKTMLFEAACHEEDRDLPHLKAIKDAAAAKK
jgi:hypothetical protein